MKMSLELNNKPLSVRVDSEGAGTLGTLVLTTAGLAFKPARHKKDPETTIPWASIPRFLNFFSEVTT